MMRRFFRTLTMLAAVLASATAYAADPPTDTMTSHHDARVTLDPDSGMVEVRNTITVHGEGRVALHLEPAFVVQSLNVDGLRRSPDRHGDALIVDVGGPGAHAIALHTRANLATKTAHEYPPLLGPEGGFLALGWLGHPRGRNATYRIEVATPLPHIAVLPGRLEHETRDDGAYTAVFSSAVPDSPPVLISGPFEVAEKMAGAARIRTYFHPELAPLADGYLTDAARYIEHYAQKIGPYPYDGFAMASGPAPVGLGLPGMTYMGRRVLALAFIRATSLPHEVLHNWWGNAVRIDHATGNWAEGLTSYQADHAQAASQARDGGRAKRLEWLRNYAALPTERDQAVTAFRAKSHDASQVVGYDKVAFIFHMLKTRLGEAAFDDALKRFYADNRHAVAGWAHMQAAFERASGEDLSGFFTAWLNRAGAPELALEDIQVEGQGDNWRVTFTLVQGQDGDAYPLSLDALVETTAGEQRVRLAMDKKRQRYTLTTDGQPLALRVDPDFNAFRRLSLDETPPIFRDVTLDAGARLIAPGDHPQIKALAQNLAQGLMQAPVAQARPAPPLEGTLIVAGLTGEVMAFLKQNALPLPPAPLTPSAQAIAYVVREDSGRTTLVAMARDEQALAQLARVLPHYKRRSFVVMDGARVTDKGAWPAPPGPLSVRLD